MIFVTRKLKTLLDLEDFHVKNSMNEIKVHDIHDGETQNLARFRRFPCQKIVCMRSSSRYS